MFWNRNSAASRLSTEDFCSTCQANFFVPICLAKSKDNERKYASSICTVPWRMCCISGTCSRNSRNQNLTVGSLTWQSFWVCRTGTACVQHHSKHHQVRRDNFVPSSQVPMSRWNGRRQRIHRYRCSERRIFRDWHRGHRRCEPYRIRRS